MKQEVAPPLIKGPNQLIACPPRDSVVDPDAAARNLEPHSSVIGWDVVIRTCCLYLEQAVSFKSAFVSFEKQHAFRPSLMC